ncbi:hypothetical protein [Magnetovirga frankeli]|uniref:hypothetical protein n=1 Tax=Magnetovirga frankeli TaxID=947516 RepID=UPI003D32C824
MTIKELAIEQIDTLAEPQIREVLDFIGYLKQKKRPDRVGRLDQCPAGIPGVRLEQSRGRGVE